MESTDTDAPIAAALQDEWKKLGLPFTSDSLTVPYHGAAAVQAAARAVIMACPEGGLRAMSANIMVRRNSSKTNLERLRYCCINMSRVSSCFLNPYDDNESGLDEDCSCERSS
jgi:hypothetical protein